MLTLFFKKTYILISITADCWYEAIIKFLKIFFSACHLCFNGLNKMLQTTDLLFYHVVTILDHRVEMNADKMLITTNIIRLLSKIISRHKYYIIIISKKKVPVHTTALQSYLFQHFQRPEFSSCLYRSQSLVAATIYICTIL